MGCARRTRPTATQAQGRFPLLGPLGNLAARRVRSGPPGMFNLTEGNLMNKDQVKGAIKDAAGKVQEKTGAVVGSTEQQIKGLAKQVEGKAQKQVGDVKEVLKDARSK